MGARGLRRFRSRRERSPICNQSFGPFRALRRRKRRAPLGYFDSASSLGELSFTGGGSDFIGGWA